MASPKIEQTIIFQDTFTEASADAALNSHTPDTGSGWSLVFRDNASDTLNAIAASDTMKPSGVDSNNGIIYSADATYPSADYEVSAKIVAGFTGTNRGYLIARLQDRENMYALRFTTGASATRMYKKVSGTWTAIGSFKADPAVGDIVKIRVVGGVLSYFYNDVLIDIQSDSAISAAGKAGIAMGGGTELASSTDDILATSELDDFTVASVEEVYTPFSTSATSMPVYLPGSIASGDLLIAVVEDRNAANYTKPTGWNDLGSQAGGGSVGKLTFFYKIADRTEGASATFTASTATTAIWRVMRIKNWHGSAAPELATASDDSSAADPPNISPSWGAEDSLFIVVAGHAAASTAAWSAAPTNYLGFKCNGASSGGAAVSVATANRQLNAASENPGSFTVSGSNRWWATGTIAVRPASSGTSTNDARAAKLTGKDIANANRSVKTTGKDTSNANRSAKTYGTETASDNRTAKTHGIDSAFSARQAKVTGQNSATATRAVKVTGVEGADSSREAKVGGIDSAFAYRGAKAVGQDSAASAINAKVTGVAWLIGTRVAKVTGKAATSDFRSAKTTGKDLATSSRSAKVSGIDSAQAIRAAKVSGQDSLTGNRQATVAGKDSAQGSRSVKATGANGVKANRSVRVTGKTQGEDSRLVKVTGKDAASSERTAKATGIDTAFSSRGARVTGKLDIFEVFADVSDDDVKVGVEEDDVRLSVATDDVQVGIATDDMGVEIAADDVFVSVK